ncbi:MAG: PASTA domain-containing protein [Flavobacteriales bacterium]
MSLFLMLLIAAGLIFFVISYLGNFTRHGEKLPVPNVIGKKLEDLDALITEEGFEYIINDSVFDNKKPKGIVVDQSPSPESFVKEGRTMYITINARTKKKITIKESVKDLSLRSAMSILQSYGVKVKVTNKPSTPEGVVLGLNYMGKKIIPGETLIDEGDMVELVVSGSSKASIYYEQFSGTLKEASNRAEALGFLVEPIQMGNLCKTESDSMSAFVVRQIPEYKNGMMLKPGTPVQLFFTCDTIAIPK